MFQKYIHMIKTCSCIIEKMKLKKRMEQNLKIDRQESVKKTRKEKGKP